MILVKGTKQIGKFETESVEGTNTAEEAGIARGTKEGWRIQTEPGEGASFYEETGVIKEAEGNVVALAK